MRGSRRSRHLQGQWVRGIIDQLELDEMGQIRVVEHKTRRKPSLPMLAQQQTAKLQVFLPSGFCRCNFRLLRLYMQEKCSASNNTEVFSILYLLQNTICMCSCGSSGCV